MLNEIKERARDAAFVLLYGLAATQRTIEGVTPPRQSYDGPTRWYWRRVHAWLTKDEIDAVLRVARLLGRGRRWLLWSSIEAKLQSARPHAADTHEPAPLKLAGGDGLDTIVANARQQIARVNEQFPRPA